jgi:hypothetical protein
MNISKIQRVIVLTLMCTVLWLLGAQLDNHTWAFGCVVLLAIALEILAYREGLQDGIEMYRNLTEQQRADIERLLKDE